MNIELAGCGFVKRTNIFGFDAKKCTIPTSPEFAELWHFEEPEALSALEMAEWCFSEQEYSQPPIQRQSL
jgi:hypothetical protein